MTTLTPNEWSEANQRALNSALTLVRTSLERHLARAQGKDASRSPSEDFPFAPPPEPASSVSPQIRSALDNVCASFSLSPFERDVLLLCAGIELNSTFAALCAAAQGDPRRTYPTFSLALAALPDAHWSALVFGSPLRRWRLIEVGNGEALTTSSLRIDERILHYLTGISCLDERLQGLVEPIIDGAALPPSQEAVATRMIETWTLSPTSAGFPVIQLCGEDEGAKRSILAAAARRLGVPAYALAASDLPTATAEREALVRLWERESILIGGVLLIDGVEPDTADNSRALHAFIRGLCGMTVLTGREPLRAGKRPIRYFEVAKPQLSEQQAIWRERLGPVAAAALNGSLASVVTHFDFGTRELHAAAAEFGAGAASGDATETADAV